MDYVLKKIFAYFKMSNTVKTKKVPFGQTMFLLDIFCGIMDGVRTKLLVYIQKQDMNLVLRLK